MGDFNIDELWKAVKNWPSAASLIGLLILEVVLMKFVWPSSKEDSFPLWLSVIILVTFISWVIYRRAPKKRKNSFGFVVSIYCDDSSTEKNFREDFIRTLKAQIRDCTIGNQIDFIELKKHLSESVTDKVDAIKVLNKCNGDFLIFGRVRTRDEKNGEKKHVLNINCVANYRLIDRDVSNIFSREIDEFLRGEITIDNSNFLAGFAFTSKLVETSSKYLIAHIIFFSKDFNSALHLYKEVLSKLPTDKSNHMAETLRNRCFESITVVLCKLIESLYETWVETHDDQYLDKMSAIFDEYDYYKLKSNYIETTRAIFLVFKNKNFNGSRAILAKTPTKLRDTIWHLNTAFLDACQGNLKKAIREYRIVRIAIDQSDEAIENNKIGYVEDFIGFFLEKNPEFSHLHYCLGFINKELKQDSSLAKTHFTDFLNCVPDTEFLTEQKLANKWLKEL